MSMEEIKKSEAEETVSKAPKLRGVITSVSMDKTISVKVDTMKTHPKYRKKYLVSKKYLVHAEGGSHKIGEAVLFQECRPMSKRKRHMVIAQEK